MATVYLGRVSGEGGFERLVALKVMHPHIASDPDFVSMFLDEARLAAQIRHPNVVATIDIQKTDEAMFLVMDFVDGPTLQDIRKHLKGRGERIPLELAMRIFIDVLSGLQEAHDQTDKDGQPLNLVHRDVSPHNVLIGKDGVSRLTDFGVARAEARISSTRGGQLKGKIAYMPPEQIMGKAVDRTADIYSAGACLWEALTGRRLWRAPNEGAMVHAILEGNPQRPSELALVPAAVEAVVMKALATNPSERYAEALDMADALEAAVRESGIRVPRTRDLGRFIRAIADAVEADPEGKRQYPSVNLERSLEGSSMDLSRDVLDQSSDGSSPSQPSAGSGPSQPVVTPISAPQPSPLSSSAANHAPPSNPGLIDSSSHYPAPQGVPGVAGVSSPSHPIPGVVQQALGSGPGADAALPDADHSQPSVVTSPTHATTTYSLQPKPSRSGYIAVAIAGGFAVVSVAFLALSGPGGDPEEGAAYHVYSHAGKTAQAKADAVLANLNEKKDGEAETDDKPVEGPATPPPKKVEPEPEPKEEDDDDKPPAPRIRYPIRPQPPKPPPPPSEFKPPTL